MSTERSPTRQTASGAMARREAGLVIFDCDGVLVDSEILVTEIEAEMLGELGASVTPAHIVEHFVGMSDAHMAEALRRDWGISLPDTFDAERSRRVEQRFNEALVAVADVRDVLDQLRDQHVLRCVASSSSPSRIAHSLQLVGLIDYFDGCLYSGAMVEHGKPAPDLFLYAARRLGITPGRCTVIEDSTHGVQAGRAAGMHVLGFTAGRHCGPQHGARLRAAGAHDVLATSADLAAALQQWICQHLN